MKNKEMNTTNSFITRTLLFMGFLLATANLCGQSPATDTTTTMPRDTVGYCPHEVSVWGAGGLSSLSYSPEFGDRSSKFGGAFGLGYTYFFHRDFGVLAGIELAFYGSSFKLDGLQGSSYRTVDIDDQKTQNIDYNTQVKNYEERQRMMNINIPLMLQYRTAVFDEHKFYASLGFKFGFPISGKYEIVDGSTLSASGYYYDSHKQELYEQRDLGYGDFNVHQEKDIGVKFSCMGAAEAGMKWALNPILSLYTGLYFEYGFNSIVKTHSEQFYDNEKPTQNDHQFNTVLTSKYDEKSFTSRVSPMAFGLKVRLGVDLCSLLVKEKPVKVEPVKEAPVPQPLPEVKEEVPAPVEVVEPQSRTARARALLAARGEEEEEKPLVLPVPTADYKLAESKYGKIKDAITIELEGYEVNQTALPGNMEIVLDMKIAEIKEKYGTGIRIICEGHTCDLGKVDYNMNLALKRANVVRDYLMQKGFSRVQSSSEGPNRPIVPNNSEENRKKNRRVVLIITD